MKALEWENREQHQANEIVRKASAWTISWLSLGPPRDHAGHHPAYMTFSKLRPVNRQR